MALRHIPTAHGIRLQERSVDAATHDHAQALNHLNEVTRARRELKRAEEKALRAVDAAKKLADRERRLLNEMLEARANSQRRST